MTRTPTLAALLKQARAAKGDTLRGAAKQLGVDPSYLHRLEAGDKTPSPALQKKVTDRYGIDPDLLLLASGQVPADVLQILQRHPEVLAKLRSDYGPS